MSSETTSLASSITDRVGWSAGRPPGPTALRAVAVVVLAGVGLGTLLAILGNMPFDPVTVSGPLRSVADLSTPVAAGAGLVTVAVSTRRTTVRVGLLFAGVFGLLALLDRAAVLPGVTALVAGGGIALLGGRELSNYDDYRVALLATGFLAAVGISLSSSVGLLDGSHRGLGALVYLLAVSGTSLRLEGDTLALLVGVVAFLALSVASTASPYVFGSALLVAFGVVGVPHLLVTLAAGAAFAVAVAGVRRGDICLGVGVLVLVLAGVPATVPAAMAVLFGATLVCLDTRTLVGEVSA